MGWSSSSGRARPHHDTKHARGPNSSRRDLLDLLAGALPVHFPIVKRDIGDEWCAPVAAELKRSEVLIRHGPALVVLRWCCASACRAAACVRLALASPAPWHAVFSFDVAVRSCGGMVVDVRPSSPAPCQETRPRSQFVTPKFASSFRRRPASPFPHSKTGYRCRVVRPCCRGAQQPRGPNSSRACACCVFCRCCASACWPQSACAWRSRALLPGTSCFLFRSSCVSLRLDGRRRQAEPARPTTRNTPEVPICHAAVCFIFPRAACLCTSLQ